jgi:hypothetical protein
MRAFFDVFSLEYKFLGMSSRNSEISTTGQSVHSDFTGIYKYAETDRYDWNINK